VYKEERRFVIQSTVPNVIHYLSVAGAGVAEPLCGDWTAGINWSTDAKVVTCADCARLLAATPASAAPAPAKATAPVAAKAANAAPPRGRNGR
jgi:hypothetical protein